MEPNAFSGRRTKPSNSDLAKALGPSFQLWTETIATVAEEAPTQEWSSYSPKAGWSLKLKQKERTVLYLSPSQGSFRAAFVLGDRAVKAALASKLPAPVMNAISKAKKYAEGTGIRLEVRSSRDITAIKQLAAIKLSH